MVVRCHNRRRKKGNNMDSMVYDHSMPQYLLCAPFMVVYLAGTSTGTSKNLCFSGRYTHIYCISGGLAHILVLYVVNTLGLFQDSSWVL